MCFFLLASVTTACHGDDDSGASSNTSALIAAQCAAIDACCVLGGQANDPARCRRLYNDIAPTDAGSRPGATLCLERLTGRTADGTICARGTASGGEDPCDGIFYVIPTPTRKPGETCFASSECAVQPGAHGDCYGDDSGNQICLERKPGKVGDGPCRTTRVPGSTPFGNGNYHPGPPEISLFECDQLGGTYCDAVTETCVAVLPLGSPCPAPESCEGLSRCAIPAGETSKRCLARIEIGGACDHDARICVEEAGCVQGTCVPHQAVNTPCDENSQCFSGRCTNHLCAPTSNLLCVP
jgi:hypothetical protein